MAKPYWEGHVTCEKCQSDIHVTVHRTRINDPEPAEYEFDVVIETQATLPFDGEEEKGE